jgi:hypothetical protein
MEKASFDNRLKKLSGLIGNHDLAERFNAEYQLLHQAIEAHKGPRFEWAARLREVGNHQLEFLSNAWLRLEREEWQPRWIV